MNLSTAQRLALDKVELLHEEVQLEKRLLRKRIEAEFERQFDALMRKQSRACHEALVLGVPKTRIGRAMGTSNWEMINRIFDLTADEAQVEQKLATQHTPPVESGDGVWTFHPDNSTLVIHRWREHGTMARRRSDDLEIPLVLDASGLWESALGRDPETTKQTKINWDLWRGIRTQVNIATGLTATSEPAALFTQSPQDDYWASYQADEDDEYRESEA